MSIPLQSVGLRLRCAAFTALFLATSCATPRPTESLTSPATNNLIAEQTQQVRSFSSAIYATQPNFALAQHQLLVLAVNAAGQTIRLAPTAFSSQQRVCFLEAAQDRLVSSEPFIAETSCFTLAAAAVPSFQLRSQADAKVTAFLSYDTRLKEWNIRSSSCAACYLVGLEMNDYSFVGVDFSRADLSKAQLRNADFSGSNLTNTHFDGANLQQANFDQAVMTQTVMKNADLKGAKLDTAKKLDVRFDGAIRK